MKTDRKIITYEKLSKLREQANRQHKKIVFTTGVYDLMHAGHIKHFDYAKSKGDILVVSVGSDKTVKMLKGPTRPIYHEKLRAQMVAALEAVDFVLISTELGKMDHNLSVELLRPDFYVVPGNDSAIQEKKKLIEDHGGELIKVLRVPPKGAKGISTTKIINELK